MSDLTVSELAKASGVSVRTLHHYDEIGLLKPEHVGQNGYRYYGQAERLRLQQILFHRELGLGLEEIRQILDASDFELSDALRRHRARLVGEISRYRDLIKTLDLTLTTLDGNLTMKPKAMYRGFDPAKQARHEADLLQRYGPGMQGQIEASQKTLATWGQGDFDGAQAELESLEAGFAEGLAFGLPADSSHVQDLTRRLHTWVARHWKAPPTADAFRGLAHLYQDHADFRARYEARATGLTDYLAEAMNAFARQSLDKT